MGSYRADNVVKALVRKLGAEPSRKTKHVFYLVRDPESRTALAFTYISHGAQEIDDTLLALMARQLRLGTLSTIKALVDCSLDGSVALQRMRQP